MNMQTEGNVALCQSMDSVNTASGEEEVRTLFVSGLPMDAKPRELYLLFRAYEGYEGSLLKVTSKNGKTASPVGFVTFNTRAGAEAAKQDLQIWAPRISPVRLTFGLTRWRTPRLLTSPAQRCSTPWCTLPCIPRSPYVLSSDYLLTNRTLWANQPPPTTNILLCLSPTRPPH
uniref:RRM domain-containing protein n=1 Tax=Graphocephala atropunctata TaxID=36148 RepID=A0A1B6M6B1_9HEMI